MLTVIGTLVSLIALFLLERIVPWNYILLAIFTLCESVLIGGVTSQYEHTSVMVVITLTLITTLFLTMASSCCVSDLVLDI